MFKSLIQNISSSLVSTALNFLIIIFTANFFGASGRGEITYIFAFTGLMQIFTAVIGSSVMVFILAKNHESLVLITSFFWAVTITALISIGLFFILDISYANLFYLFLITISQTFFNNLIAYCTAKIMFKAISILRVVQPLTLFLGLLFFYYYYQVSLDIYYKLLIISFLPATLIICYLTFKQAKAVFDFSQIKAISLEFLKLGGLNQLNNLMQYGSYRFAIWSISNFLGIKEVGVFGLWLTVCDAIWLIPIALASVNQAYAAKPNYEFKLLAKYIVSALLISFCVVIIAILLPVNFYQFVLGKDFIMLKRLLIFSSPVLIMFSIPIIFAYYFSAKGLIKYNFFASGLGFLAVIGFSTLFIRYFGLIGAVLANCLSYSLSTIMLILFYFKHKRELNLNSTLNN